MPSQRPQHQAAGPDTPPRAERPESPESPEIIEADWTWIGAGFAPGVQLRVASAGRVEEVGRLGLAATRRLYRQALLPGLVSAHSHAFQRALRGLGERFPAGAGSFWSWREAMYELAEGLDGAGFERLCLRTFREMRAAGITAVGEFHYFHHESRDRHQRHQRHQRNGAPGGPGAPLDYALDARVLRAAAAAGVRILPLGTHFRTARFG